jgi:hypothetical protein
MTLTDTQRYRRKLVSRKYLYLDQSDNKYEIVCWEFVDEGGLVILGRRGRDWGVFSWWSVTPSAVPADKFTYGDKKNGLELYSEILADLRKEKASIAFRSYNKCPGCKEAMFIRIMKSDLQNVKPILGECTFCGRKQKVRLFALRAGARNRDLALRKNRAVS